MSSDGGDAGMVTKVDPDSILLGNSDQNWTWMANEDPKAKRDYFAEVVWKKMVERTDIPNAISPKALAGVAYEYADAMMEAREKKD